IGGGGVKVVQVVDNSPAARAGIQKDDIILKIAGRGINKPEDISAVLADRNPGEEVEVVIRRGDKEQVIRVTLGSR
ncbi:MAG: PDZ domain-containing protein, partial [Planctomycetota bacterium]|nr:PDZ domain-containing protein [Planctomycetota bacterium]